MYNAYKSFEIIILIFSSDKRCEIVTYYFRGHAVKEPILFVITMKLGIKMKFFT